MNTDNIWFVVEYKKFRNNWIDGQGFSTLEEAEKEFDTIVENFSNIDYVTISKVYGDADDAPQEVIKRYES